MRWKSWVAGVAAVLFAGAGALAQDAKSPPDVTGAWHGNLNVNNQIKVRLVLKVSKGDDGKLKGEFLSPDQTPKPFEVSDLSFDGKSLAFKLPTMMASYKGELDPEKKQVKGEWTQGPLTLPLVLEPGEGKSAAVEAPAALLGLWKGTLDVGAAQLRLVLRVEEKDGKRTAVLDSIDQGVNGIPLSAMALEGDKLTFESGGIGGKYEGTLNKEKTKIEGTWTQLGRSYPLNFEKTDKIEEVRRPQHPKPPFPYQVEELTFRNDSANLTLAGSHTLPAGDGPFPAVVLISGSGPQDRDETLMGHKPFLVISDHLTRQGIAVLRFDDRGHGKSTGKGVMQSTSEEIAGDVMAAVDALKADRRIRSDAIGLAGHSEGGLIAPIVAAKRPDVAFAVLIAGTGVPGDEILVAQTDLISRTNPKTSEAEIRKDLEELKEVIAVMKSAPDAKTATEKLKAVLADQARRGAAEKADAKDKDKADSATETPEAVITALGTPWMRYFLTYDPRTMLRQVKCPVLAINGEKDLQVPPAQNLPEIEKALKEGGNSKVTIREFPGLNHLFQHATTGSPSEYGRIEETFAPEALELIATWIREQTAAK